MKVGIDRIYNYFQPEQKLQKQLAINITVQGSKSLSQPNSDKKMVLSSWKHASKYGFNSLQCIVKHFYV